MTIPVRPFWAVPALDKLPPRRRGRLEREWRKLAQQSQHGHGSADGWLQRRLAELEAGQRAGITPGMGDAELCKLADSEARDYANNLSTVEGRYRVTWAHMPADYLDRCIAWKKERVARFLMAGRGLADLWPAGPGVTPAGALARLTDPAFWRRVFRRVHARTVEQCAIAMGLVNKAEDCYISREGQRIVSQRAAANAAMLSKTKAVNEYGDEMTLAEIAERSVSNPTIRRGELMTRVAGFEHCADQLGHVKRWAVLTCPSRMHKFTQTKGGQVVPNARYDGTQPREAQTYLAQQWRRLCAHWEREGLRVYGFRTTEPHHDGCPHWNVLCFFAPMTERVQLKRVCKLPTDAVAVFDAGLRRYYLQNDNPTEPGAAKHRVRIEAITSDKGSAAAYIAKYISKGVDGFALDFDLYGNPMVEATAAVVAWARLWGIRQFQQIGGPPVTVWRELRRLHPDNAGEAQQTPDTMAAALAAVNLQLVEPGEKKAVAWSRYVQAQGGPTCKRVGHRVKLWKRAATEPNRYGEPAMPRVCGVVAAGQVVAVLPHMAAMGLRATFQRPAMASVESERAAWVVVPAVEVLAAYDAQCQRLEAAIAAHDQRQAEDTAQRLQWIQRQEHAAAILRERLTAGAAGRPWTRVNNCTPALSMTPALDQLDRAALAGQHGFSVVKTERRKLGRYYQWNSGKAGGPSNEENQHEHH